MASGLRSARIGDYRLVEAIGRGGVAEVHRAVANDGSGREAAVKILLPDRLDDRDQLRALANERDLLEDLDHTSIPTYLDEGEIAGRPALVMEYFPGPTLYQLQQAEQRFDVISALYALVNVVAYLHRLRVLHCDLKLENLIVRPEGRLGLVDFGTAQRKASTKAITGMFRRRPKKVFGTPTYIAPEVLKGGRHSTRSDVYAIGVCAHLLIAGKPPFDEATVAERMRASVSALRAPRLRDRNPQVPAEFADLIDACLIGDPALRLEDAEVLRQHLKQRFGGKNRTRPAESVRPGALEPRR